MHMKLAKSNPFLVVAREAESGLFISAKTSSAIEGIRQPFTSDAKMGRFTSASAFTEHWKRRASKSAR